MSPQIHKQTFIWFPPARHYGKITINGATVTERVQESSFIKSILQIGIGSFSVKLIDSGGQYLESFSKGQEVVYYLGETNSPTTVQFKGRIDYSKRIHGKDGQYVELIGRHKSYRIAEIKVCLRMTGDHGAIFRQIITSYAPEFNSDNVQNTGLTTSVEWDYLPFIDCVKQLCTDSGFMSYVNDDLQIYFLLQGSVENNDYGVVESHTFLRTEEYGTDDFYERTRVTAIGQDDSGIPIIDTVISPTESEIREERVIDTSANTMAKVQALAQAKYNEYSNRSVQSKFICHAHRPVNPSDKIYVSLNRQKIHGQYNIAQITDQFGTKIGPPQQIVVLNLEIRKEASIIRERISNESKLSTSNNINKLNYSLNFDYNDDSLTEQHDRTEIQDGALILSTGQVAGIWTSTTLLADQDITQLELKYAASDFGASTVEYTVDEGANWNTIPSRDTLINVTDTGNRLKVRVNLNQNTLNPSPTVDGLAILYS